MKKSYYFASVLMLTFLFFTSCTQSNNSGNLYTPSSGDATSTATLADLQQGRTLYMNNCGSCHSLYSPDDYAPASWKSIVPNMAGRANLSSAQSLLVTKYVTRGK